VRAKFWERSRLGGSFFQAGALPSQMLLLSVKCAILPLDFFLFPIHTESAVASKKGKKDKTADAHNGKKKLDKDFYEKELARLQVELVKLQEWIKHKGLKVVVIFEGRDSAGKGGVIKRITESLNPRICRIEALGTPTERENTQWYFQRYVARLPAAGEMVLFDRSWYNRAGVERVMGFCTEEECLEFMRSCPEFERMLVRSGVILIKYWFSVSDEVQEARFQARLKDRAKRWKLSPMDLESRARWVDYSKAKDEMFIHTDIKQAPWYVVDADDKRRARLNCIHHFLSLIPYKDTTPEQITLPPRQQDGGYVRPPMSDQNFVPEVY
jgi:polyphosphate kinase